MKRLLLILAMLPVLAQAATYTNDFSSATGADTVLITGAASLTAASTCGTVTMTGGTLTMAGYTLSVSNQFIKTGGVLNAAASGSTINLLGDLYSNTTAYVASTFSIIATNPATIYSAGTSGYGTLSVAATGNTVVWAGAGSRYAVNLIVNGGTLVASGDTGVGSRAGSGHFGNLTGALTGSGVLFLPATSTWNWYAAGGATADVGSVFQNIDLQGTNANSNFILYGAGSSLASPAVFLATNSFTVGAASAFTILQAGATLLIKDTTVSLKRLLSTSNTDVRFIVTNSTVNITSGAAGFLAGNSVNSTRTNVVQLYDSTLLATSAVSFTTGGTNILVNSTIVSEGDNDLCVSSTAITNSTFITSGTGSSTARLYGDNANMTRWLNSRTLLRPATAISAVTATNTGTLSTYGNSLTGGTLYNEQTIIASNSTILITSFLNTGTFNQDGSTVRFGFDTTSGVLSNVPTLYNLASEYPGKTITVYGTSTVSNQFSSTGTAPGRVTWTGGTLSLVNPSTSTFTEASGLTVTGRRLDIIQGTPAKGVSRALTRNNNQ